MSVHRESPMLLATMIFPALLINTMTAEYVFVGTWNNAASITTHFLNVSTGAITWVDSTGAAGAQIEALLVVKSRSSGDQPLLIAASNVCADRDPGSKECKHRPSHGGPKLCSVSSLRLGRGGMPSLELLSRVWSGGLGPTALSLHPSGSVIAVANYNSGLAAMLPLDAAGHLSKVTMSTRQLNKSTSLAHDVTFDDRCGSAASLLMVDAGAEEMASFDLRNKHMQAIGVWPTAVRMRRVAIHPQYNVLYALYELDGSVGVWPWSYQAKDGGCGSLAAHSELSRAAVAWPNATCAQNSSQLSEWQPTCMTALGTQVMRPFPTELAISPDGRTLYVSSAQQVEPGADSPNGTISVYSTNATHLELLQVYAVSSGARSLALTTAGDFVLAVDPSLGVLSSHHVDRGTGRILGVASTSSQLQNASSIAVWAP